MIESLKIISLACESAKINIFLTIFSIMVALSNHFDSIGTKECIERSVPLLASR